MTKRVLISGYRDFWDSKVVSDEIAKEGKDIMLILGDCPNGVDKLAQDYAIQHGIEAHIYEADWSGGRGGGPARNKMMIVDGKPDIGLLFLSPKSKGTLNMLNQLKTFNVPFRVIHIS